MCTPKTQFFLLLLLIHITEYIFGEHMKKKGQQAKINSSVELSKPSHCSGIKHVDIIRYLKTIKIGFEEL